MRKHEILGAVALVLLTLAGCRDNKGKQAGSGSDLVTIKTLGLAYLEEFRHEEAEKEFLRFIELAPEDKFGYANLGLVYLRLGRYPEAEEQLGKARKLAPDDPDISLLLATVYKMDNKREIAISELSESLKKNPDHIKSLFELSELYLAEDGDSALAKRTECLDKMTALVPANLVPRLSLAEIAVKRGETDKAMEMLENIKKSYPEFSSEALDYYDKTMASLRKKDRENAVLNFTILFNYLKVSIPYQAGMTDLKGPGGALIGFPVITFAQQTSARIVENELLLDIMKFRDATVSAGLALQEMQEDDDISIPVAAANDYDGDGDIDIYVNSFDPASSSWKPRLYRNETGRFTDMAASSGFTHSGKENTVQFVDYDNDGHRDVYIARDEGNLMYRNNGDGTFRETTSSLKADFGKASTLALFFDYDHDGDLDLFQGSPGGSQLFRNNADGTFILVEDSPGIAERGSQVTDAAFGDFDEDGDIDLVSVHPGRDPVLATNLRQGSFSNIASSGGLSGISGISTVAAGDFDNDGFLDILLAGTDGGKFLLLRNRNNGTFETDNAARNLSERLKGISISDACFTDFNNDGYLDIVVAGKNQEPGGRELFLFYSDGKGKFTDCSEILPQESISARKVGLFDYNDDGDIDFLVAGSRGKISLLRNDGGNENHYIRMKLVGLRAGSAKNNHFGIGAKVEVRAGDLYQTLVVTDPNIHFGLGTRSYADVIRITWTNGVPQNIFLPGSDQKLIEAQTLKGSCPFLYTWNGNEFEFSKDIMWRSALGMPTGIMGGTKQYAFANASDDYIKIDGEALDSKDGEFTIKITSELWETIYTDKIELIAADHPSSTDIYVPEQFTPPPFPGYKLHTVSNKKLPLSAKDCFGNDVLAEISERDFIFAGGMNPGRYQGIVESNELVLDPGNAVSKGRLLLFLHGWIFPTDASINAAIDQGKAMKPNPPVIQVLDKSGKWKTVIDNLGFPMGKDKTVIADLSGKFLSENRLVRVLTNMEIYWDEVFFSDDEKETQVISTPLSPEKADLSYRGFSASFRKGGRYGPHWFDYSKTEKGPKWRDLTGNYTRYGDVTPLLESADNMYIISNAGDEITITFDGTRLPGLPKGWRRDFFIHSVGWVKDGDMNTATGNTVEPLPWHGMKAYPPLPGEKYPDNEELRTYNREYNTRIVTGSEYRDALKPAERKR